MTDPADTYDRIEQAIRDHIATIGDGSMLTDWVLTAASVGGFNGTGYTHLSSQATAAHSHLGLALATYRHAKAEWDNDDDEDDE
jgi:hypothetical protein